MAGYDRSHDNMGLLLKMSASLLKQSEFGWDAVDRLTVPFAAAVVAHNWMPLVRTLLGVLWARQRQDIMLFVMSCLSLQALQIQRRNGNLKI